MSLFHKLAIGAGLLVVSLNTGCLDDQRLVADGYIPPSPPPPSVQVAAVPVVQPSGSASPATVIFRGSPETLESMPGYKEDKDKKNPVPADAASIKRGAETYASNCAICHGDKGEGDGANAPLLPQRPRNLTQGVFLYGSEDWEVYRTISEGIPPGPMLPWKEILTEEKDRWDVVNYVKSLQASKPSAGK